ncbi:MAG: regulatory protein GemA [Leptospiraceae bacterium]|nr:DUF1018 domain-containing protein [Leptospiraceae bacterium]MCK6380858.1 regulatory protein GemA [Leptospiraceae bacterium]
MNTTTSSKITPAQLRKIWASARDKGIDSDLLHTIVYQKTGKEHISDLHLGEAKRVIDRICGRRKQSKFQPSGRVAKMSFAQRTYLESLIGEIKKRGYGYTLEALSTKVVHKAYSQNLTRYEASKIITACKEILVRVG